MNNVLVYVSISDLFYRLVPINEMLNTFLHNKHLAYFHFILIHGCWFFAQTSKPAFG